MLDQAAQAQLAHGGALRGLLIGQPADGIAQKIPMLGQRFQQVGALASRSGPGSGPASCVLRPGHAVPPFGYRGEAERYGQGLTDSRRELHKSMTL